MKHTTLLQKLFLWSYLFITNSIPWERTSIKFLQTPGMALSKASYVPGTVLGILDIVVEIEQRNFISS